MGTATNAKASARPGEDPLALGESQDCYVLNLKSLVWTQLEILTPSGKASKVSACIDRSWMVAYM